MDQRPENVHNVANRMRHRDWMRRPPRVHSRRQYACTYAMFRCRSCGIPVFWGLQLLREVEPQ